MHGMKFRQKTAVVEALRVPLYGPFDPRAAARTIDEWGRLWVFLGPGGSWEVADDLGITFDTFDPGAAQEHAQPGEWIVRGENGELHAYSHEVFEETYEGYDA